MTDTLALLLAIAGSGAAAIALDWRQRHPLFWLFKPLTTLLVIALAARTPHADPTLLLTALLLCLGGDLALLGHGKRAFLAGLVLFLLGHWCFMARYGRALMQAAAPESPALLTLVITAVLVVAVTAYTRWLLPRTGRLRIPVLVYTSTLLALVLLALWLADATGGGQWLAFCGALSFGASDAMLAWRRFVRPPLWGQAFTLATYYSGITLFSLAP